MLRAVVADKTQLRRATSLSKPVVEEGGVHLVQLQEGHCVSLHVVPQRIVWAARQRIRFPSLLPWAEDDLEVEAGQLLCPSGLAPIVHLGLRKPQEVAMVGEDDCLVTQSLEIMAVAIHGLHDCQHLLVVDLIVEFRQIELATVEGYRVEYSVLGAPLGDDSPESIVRSIGFQDDG